LDLLDYFDEFVAEMRQQLEADQARWGDTWKKRVREGQERRTRARYQDYFDQFENGGTPIPWLKIVGGAFICWVRERYPDYTDR